ncbi:MAG TPA: hypothetical protein VEL48_01960, partial [Candidatus Acidoferrales bacterium]|nr:hypothetical protein [Candidatus Acidoferrales bacterium]
MPGILLGNSGVARQDGDMAASELSVEPIARAEWWRRTPRQPARDWSAVQPHPANSPVAFWALTVFMGILMLAPQAI